MTGHHVGLQCPALRSHHMHVKLSMSSYLDTIKRLPVTPSDDRTILDSRIHPTFIHVLGPANKNNPRLFCPMTRRTYASYTSIPRTTLASGWLGNNKLPGMSKESAYMYTLLASMEHAQICPFQRSGHNLWASLTM